MRLRNKILLPQGKLCYDTRDYLRRCLRVMKEFNEITMIKLRRLLYITTMLTAVLFLCTGCSNEREEKQLQLREQGITYLENEQYKEAIEAFQCALDESLGEIDEVELDICYYKAEAQYLSGDVEGAVGTYTAIINYNNDPRAYYLRGNLNYTMNEEYALKDYASAAEYDKHTDYELYIGIYEAMKAHGNNEGTAYLEEALKIKGDTAYDKMQKGRIKFLLGSYGDAVTLLEEAAAGKEYEAYFYLAEVYLSNLAISSVNAMEEAKNNMNAYIASGVADSYKLYNIAENQLNKGYYDISISCLEAALKLKEVPNKQIVMKTLAIAYEKTSNFVVARDVLTDYVKLYPEDEEAKRELTFLETR